MNRILVITLSNIGDLVMTTPVFEALYTVYPHAVIDVVADKRSSDVLKGAPYLGKIYHREKKGGLVRFFRLIFELRKTYYDAVIDLRTNIIPSMLRSHKRIYKRKRLFSEQHSVDEHYSSLSKLDKLASIPSECRVYVEEAARSEAAELIKGLCGQKILAIGPGANWPGKIWPASKFEDLVVDLTDYFDGVIQLGASGEGLVFSDRVKINCIDLTGKTTLAVLKAVLDNSQVFVGNDSGLGHLAAALGKPSVTVFGKGDPSRYKPWGHRAVAVVAPLRDLNRLEYPVVSDAIKQVQKEHGS